MSIAIDVGHIPRIHDQTTCLNTLLISKLAMTVKLKITVSTTRLINSRFYRKTRDILDVGIAAKLD